MPGFMVWEFPGGLIWEGDDQEEAILVGLNHCRQGVLVEVAEVYNLAGDLRPRRIAHCNGRQRTEASS